MTFISADRDAIGLCVFPPRMTQQSKGKRRLATANLELVTDNCGDTQSGNGRQHVTLRRACSLSSQLSKSVAASR